VFFCVHDTAATRGQYLALSKAWRSNYYYHHHSSASFINKFPSTSND